MFAELKEKDRVPLPDNVMAWVRVAQREFYCLLCSDDEEMLKKIHGNTWKDYRREIHTCACIGWDSSTTMYRFWLCPHARPKYQLTWKEMFADGNRRRT